MTVKLFIAAKALILHRGKILLIRESKKYRDGTRAGLWDFPGGRIKPGERFDKSLMREVKEETGLTVKIIRPLHVSEWRPTVRGKSWQIVGIIFECRTTSSRVKLSPDHDEFVWVQPADIQKYAIDKTYLPAIKALSPLSSQT